MRCNTLLFFLVLTLAPLFTAFAADATPAQTQTGFQWLSIIPFVVPVIIGVFKLLWPKIPSSALPIVAPILGALIEIFTSGAIGQGTLWGAALGSAGVGLREIYDQMTKKKDVQ